MKTVFIVIGLIIVLGAVIFYFANPKIANHNDTQNSLPINTEDTASTTKVNSEIVNIKISNYSFTQNIITIKKGTTVVWSNYDKAKHSVKADDGIEFSSNLFGEGESFSHTFDKIGTFNYYCEPHTKMRGTIIVE